MRFWTKLFETKDTVSNNLSDTKQTDKIPTSKKSELLLPLLESVKTLGHPENLLLRKEYESRMPCTDFTSWLIEKFKQKDYESIWAFAKEYFGYDESSDGDINIGSMVNEIAPKVMAKKYEMNIDDAKKQWSKIVKSAEADDKSKNQKSLREELFEKFINKDFSSYLVSDEKLIFEIQYFFLLREAMYDSLAGFSIGNNDETSILSKIICAYPFSIKSSGLEILISKANQFIKKMKKEEKEYKAVYWKAIPYFNITDINLSYTINTKTDILNKLQSLGIGERLHFFDFASSHSFAKYWSGNSRFKTKQIGVCETESVKKMTELNLFTYTDDIECIPYIATKDEFKSKAEQGGFELKKSWNVQKIYEYLIKSEEGKIFLKNYIQVKKPVKFNAIYDDDLHLIIDFQEQIKIISQLISMI